MNQLEIKLGYTFNDPKLLEQALIHPSYRNEKSLDHDNQRMEFLGDATLGLAAADYLYKTYPDEPEGRMTKLRSLATSTATLARLAQQISLGEHLQLGHGECKSGGREKASNLADAMEAVIGAVYLDGKQKSVDQLFKRLFVSLLNDSAGQGDNENPKGTLQEWAQAQGFPCPVYDVTETDGPAHDRWFTVAVCINEQFRAAGSGSTIRSAEADAAARLLEEIMNTQG